MGMKSSAWYRKAISEIEDLIYEELKLAGVRQVENDGDQIEFYNDRLDALYKQQKKYEKELEEALARESGDSDYSFIPRREFGN